MVVGLVLVGFWGLVFGEAFGGFPWGGVAIAGDGRFSVSGVGQWGPGIYK